MMRWHVWRHWRYEYAYRRLSSDYLGVGERRQRLRAAWRALRYVLAARLVRAADWVEGRGA